MTENENSNYDLSQSSYRGLESVQDTMDMFLASADVHAVFAEPVEHGQHLIIPAAEIISIAGFGMGSGGYNEHNPERLSPGAVGTDSGGTDSGGTDSGGGGGGGGGRVFSRPVAVIVASADRVSVKPVFDITKIALAALTAFGFMVATIGKIQSGKIKEE